MTHTKTNNNYLSNKFRKKRQQRTSSRSWLGGIIAATLLYAPVAAVSAQTPLLSLSADAVSEGEKMKVTIGLAPVSPADVTATFFTRADSAKPGQDFYGATYSINIPAGEDSAVVWIDTLSDELVEGDESFLLFLARANGAEIRQPSIRATILDNATDATRFSIDEIRTNEDSETTEITVRRSGSSRATDTVRLFTRPDTARPRQDFFGFSRDITFSPGQTEARTTINIVNDSIVEPQERLQLILRNGRSIAARSFVTILDDDDNGGALLPRLTLRSEVVTEGDGSVDVLVRLSGIASEDVKLTVFTQNLTARGGEDFYGFTKDITIPSGVLSSRFSVDILDDNVVEGEELLALKLTGVTGAIDSQRETTITIIDDDGTSDEPEIRITNTPLKPFENDGSAVVQLSLSEASTERVSVNVETIEIDRLFPTAYARAPEDFLLKSETVVFEPGETTAVFSVDLVDDNVQESSETLPIRLSNPVGAKIGANSRNTTLLIVDDEPPMLPVVELQSIVVFESAGFITIDVARPELRFDLSATPIATIDVIADTAVEGEDYIPFADPIRVVLPFDEGGQTVPFAQLIDNNIDDADVKRINLVISDVENGLAGGEASVLILDDESAPFSPFVLVDIPHVTEAALSANVAITLSKAGTETIQVSVTTEDDTAVAGEDYTGVTTTVIFNPGETRKSIVVPILEDDQDEAALERFNVKITDVSGAEIGVNGGVFIRDNDL